MNPTSLTYDDLVGLVQQYEGRPLETVTGRGFNAGIARTGETFLTPSSSGYGQSDGRRAGSDSSSGTTRRVASDLATTRT